MQILYEQTSPDWEESIDGEIWCNYIRQYCPPMRISNLGNVLIWDKVRNQYLPYHTRVSYSKKLNYTGKIVYTNSPYGCQQFRLDIVVANLFVPNPNGWRYVRHLSGDNADCRADNLEWVKYSEKQIAYYNRTGKFNKNQYGEDIE